MFSRHFTFHLFSSMQLTGCNLKMKGCFLICIFRSSGFFYGFKVFFFLKEPLIQQLVYVKYTQLLPGKMYPHLYRHNCSIILFFYITTKRRISIAETGISMQLALQEYTLERAVFSCRLYTSKRTNVKTSNARFIKISQKKTSLYV